MLVQGDQFLFCVLWSIHSRGVHGLGDKVSGYSTTVNVQGLYVPEVYLVHWYFFSVKITMSVLGSTLTGWWFIRIFKLWDVGLKECCCTRPKVQCQNMKLAVRNTGSKEMYKVVLVLQPCFNNSSWGLWIKKSHNYLSVGP